MTSLDHQAVSGTHENTRLAQAGSRWCGRTGAVSMPIYKSATFRHPGVGQSTGFDYSRTANPTRQELEAVLASMEGAERALAFSTGMAAVDCVLRLFSPGDVIQVIEDLYGGTVRLVNDIYKKYGLTYDYVNTADLEATAAKIRPETKMIFIETPSNPMMLVSEPTPSRPPCSMPCSVGGTARDMRPCTAGPARPPKALTASGTS